MKIHKQGCLANVSCLVFHPDGKCSGPCGKCTCDGNETNISVPMPPNTEKCGHYEAAIGSGIAIPAGWICRVCNPSTPPPENYERISHNHCFNQLNPPCGKKAHAQCCLCDVKPVEVSIVLSGRLDYCGKCGIEHGYDCPEETPAVEDWSNADEFILRAFNLPVERMIDTKKMFALLDEYHAFLASLREDGSNRTVKLLDEVKDYAKANGINSVVDYIELMQGKTNLT